MLINTKGIIVRTMKYSESSIITDIYTEKVGMQSFIISGVRSKSAKTKAGIFQIMTIVDLVAYFKSSSKLNRIKEIKLGHVYETIPFQVPRSAVGTFMIEIARKSIVEPEENPKLFKFVCDAFIFLDTTQHSFANLHLRYMLELTSYLGFLPGGAFTDKTCFFDLKEGIFLKEPPDHLQYMEEEMSDYLSHFLQMTKEDCHEIKMNRVHRKTLLLNLIDYFRLHVDNFPTVQSHIILEEVI